MKKIKEHFWLPSTRQTSYFCSISLGKKRRTLRLQNVYYHYKLFLLYFSRHKATYTTLTKFYYHLSYFCSISQGKKRRTLRLQNTTSYFCSISQGKKRRTLRFSIRQVFFAPFLKAKSDVHYAHGLQ